MEISVHIIIISILLRNRNNIEASSFIKLLSLFLLCEYMQLYSIFQNKYDKILENIYFLVINSQIITKLC